MAESDPGDRNYDNMLKMLSDLNKDLEKLLEEMEKISGGFQVASGSPGALRVENSQDEEESTVPGSAEPKFRRPGWPMTWW
ncbi:synaptonemal complex central element protein 3 isoform X2 [Macrotis lagotis]|uniref:synaptonemal complex central element protein 3 isoform X2 n=1 Tax=Macrotis lagotis TaxID=92651 RepID=UPI003D6970F2